MSVSLTVENKSQTFANCSLQLTQHTWLQKWNSEWPYNDIVSAWKYFLKCEKCERLGNWKADIEYEWENMAAALISTLLFTKSCSRWALGWQCMLSAMMSRILSMLFICSKMILHTVFWLDKTCTLHLGALLCGICHFGGQFGGVHLICRSSL